MPVEIPLTRGLVALVDEADAPLVLPFRWYASPSPHVYACRASRLGEGRGQVLMHRAIMGALPGQFVDHRDGNGLNNTRANLRFATNHQNQGNRLKTRGSRAQFKGVRQEGAATFHVRIGGKHVAIFPTAEAAARAYDDAARLRWGAFAAVNFPRSGERSAITGEIAP